MRSVFLIMLSCDGFLLSSCMAFANVVRGSFGLAALMGVAAGGSLFALVTLTRLLSAAAPSPAKG
jgi:hypothetical protein